MPDIGYLNGQFSPLDEIKISPDDRGFLFGDGVYEVVPVYGGQPFRFTQHLVYKAAAYPFAGYHQWSRFGETPELSAFVQRATPGQRGRPGALGARPRAA